jgi:hypothetical protein
MKKWLIFFLTGVACVGASAALAAGCNRNETCPPICTTDDSDACTHITNTAQMCALRVYTCNGCIAAAASRLKVPVACVRCVVDAQAAGTVTGACVESCGDAAVVESVVQGSGC